MEPADRFFHFSGSTCAYSNEKLPDLGWPLCRIHVLSVPWQEISLDVFLTYELLNT
jgi:hypothetical protein